MKLLPRLFRRCPASLVISIALHSQLLNLLCNPAWACDLCSIYDSFKAQRHELGGKHLSVTEQFTLYDKVQRDGIHADNAGNERISSSQTHFAFSYDLSDRFSLQANLPLVARHYRRVEEDGVTRGSDSGVGDISLAAKFVALNCDNYKSRNRLVFFAGVELPSGDTGRLAEEAAHDHGHHAGDDHAEVFESAVHGHDLALGSGSVDYPLGLSWIWQRNRWQFTTDAQYTIRSEGAHNYRYGNDFIWNAGSGYFLHLEDEKAAVLSLNLGGEYKEHDESSGKREDETKIKSVLIGLELLVTVKDNLSFKAGLEVPLDINNTGTQLVMAYRLRAALNYRF